MIDLLHLENYRENNRIEAKKAVGGLPQSIWETYSAFANSLGGIILLGVEEYPDKSLHPVDLPDPQRLVKEFWDLANNPKKVNINVLTSKDVHIETIDGKDIIVITVPRAQRFDRPIYVDGNLLSGTYRRNGEGDYHCSKEEVQAMLRDASVQTQDMLVLEEMDIGVFNDESVRSYRQRMALSRPGHVWGELDNETFLLRLGAIGRSADGQLHPTGAGLLMFGNEYDIVREFNYYFLDYQEHHNDTIRWTDRFISSSGDWSGNLYDFFYRAYQKLTLDLKVPFQMDGIYRVEDTPVHRAIREALANCLINADYYGRRGLVITKDREKLQFSNPGGFRLDVKEAISGGLSDPRNSAIMKMFTMLDIGERAGSGIPNIFRVWREQGWPEPEIAESFEPPRITTTLFIATVKSGSDNNSDNRESSIVKSDASKRLIVSYLTDHPFAKCSEIADYLGVKSAWARRLLGQLVKDSIVTAEGANRNRTYRLKS